MVKLDKAARKELEETIDTLEDLGWDVTDLHVDGDPGVMRVDISMMNRMDSKYRIQEASGGVDRD